MAKFKVGDRVRAVLGAGFSNDAVGVVTAVTPWHEYPVSVLRSGASSPVGFRENELELVEDSNSPIRTVTRREIVPGVYRDVQIHEYFGNSVGVEYDGDGTVESLREAARIFNEIADVLEENAA